MIRRAGTTLSVLALAGCTLAPGYRPPELPVSAHWPSGDAYSQPAMKSLPHYDYRQVFADPRLAKLIALALANNQDVAAAAANVASARAQFHIQRASLFPEIDAAGSVKDSGGSGTLNPGKAYNAELANTGYELDLFGRVRSLTSAAKARYFASASAEQATRLALVANVAEAWLNHAADQSLLAIARDTAASQQQVVDLTRKRLDGGIAPRSDLRQAELTLDTAEADVAQQTTAAAQDVNALQLLVGTPIDPALLSNSIEDAGARLTDIPAGMSSTILLRRPDVVEAEYQLRAANANIGAARASLFPRITLTGLLGFASHALSALFTGGAYAWQAAGSASYPIFAGGAGKASIAQSKAQRDAALAAYRKAIESAFRDTANALARRGTIDAQLKAVSAGRDAAADNAHLADLRYRGGISSYLASLTAQQALYTARRALVATELVRATNQVEIYRALGADSAIVSRPGI